VKYGQPFDIEEWNERVTLLTSENHNLREANEALSKRRRARKTRVRQRGVLTAEDARDVLAQKEVEEQAVREMRENRSRTKARPATTRRCGACGKPGHNTRTCQVDVEMPDVYSSE
jgi:hypothetical protein